MTTRADYTRHRDRELRKLILITLANTPDNYLQPESVLLATLRHTMVPEVTQGELDRAQEWLETEDLIYCHRDTFLGTSWCITATGRARAANF